MCGVLKPILFFCSFACLIDLVSVWSFILVLVLHFSSVLFLLVNLSVCLVHVIWFHILWVVGSCVQFLFLFYSFYYIYSLVLSPMSPCLCCPVSSSLPWSCSFSLTCVYSGCLSFTPCQFIVLFMCSSLVVSMPEFSSVLSVSPVLLVPPVFFCGLLGFTFSWIIHRLFFGLLIPPYL